MADKIVHHSIKNVDVADTIFTAIENQMPDDSDAFYAVMGQIQHLIGPEFYFDLELAANLRVGQALEDGFKIGWDMRSKV